MYRERDCTCANRAASATRQYAPGVKSLLIWAGGAMKSVLAKAGASLTTLGLGGMATYWIAVDTTTGLRSPLLFWVFGGTAVVGA